MLDVKRITNRIFKSNTYILSSTDDKDIWLVDCGDVDKIIQEIGEKAQIKGVLLTHTHFDHIYGLNELVSIYPDLSVNTIEFGIKALYDDRLNFSRYHETSFVFSGHNARDITALRDTPLIGGIPIDVIPTPGHSPDCLSYKIGKYLFTGDSFIPNVKVMTTLRGGDKQEALMSEMRLKDLSQSQNLIVCPGHCEMGYI